MKKLLFLCLAGVSLLLSGQDIQSDVIAPAGDFDESDHYAVSWTLGEVAVGTYGNDNHMITQGFQQGNLRVSNVVDEQTAGFVLKAYPNPVIDKLHVSFETDRLVFQMVDLDGRPVFNGNLYSGSGIIDCTQLAPGTYFLLVNQRQTHKIIKN